MELGKRIKTFREKINMSQEELADKVYTSRQTISNWENDKTYPDINSLKLLSNIFDVSLDNLIEWDIDIMKRKINETDRKGFITLSRLYSLELIIMIVSAYPLLKFVGYIGLGIWILFTLITIITAFTLEKIKNEYDVKSYKEIVAFFNNKLLTHEEKIEEKAKWPYQKVILTILSGVIAFIVFILLEVLIG